MTITTKVKNLGPRRFIRSLPPNGRTLNHDQIISFDGFLDAALFLTDATQNAEVESDENEALLEIWYDLGGRALKAVADPVADNDVATKGYVDSNAASGPPGLAGPAGATWSQGAGIPSSGFGANGDFYFRTATDDVYFKAAGAWSIIANIKGANGTNAASGFQFQFLADATGGVPTGKLCYTNSSTSYLLFPSDKTDAQGRDLTDVLAGIVAGTRFRISNLSGTKGRYGYLRTAIGASSDVTFGLGAGLVTEIILLQNGGSFDLIDGEALVIEFFGNVESVVVVAASTYVVQYEDHKVIYAGSSSASVTLPDPAKHKNREITVVATQVFGPQLVNVISAASSIVGPTALTGPAACSYCSDGIKWYAFGWTSGTV